MKPKNPVSFRLPKIALDNLEKLAEHYGLGDKTKVMEWLIYKQVKEMEYGSKIAELERRIQQLENKTP